MINKKMLTSAILLGMVGTGFAGQAYAAEGDLQTIDGNGKPPATSADVITRGTIGKIDNTDPNTPLPDGDDRWINVTLPTEVMFEVDKDGTNIISPKNYQIKNNSGRPVKVDVTEYNIESGTGISALKELNIKRTSGFGGQEKVNLVSGQAVQGKLTINKEFVRLANKNGDFAGANDVNSNATNFEFTGTVDTDGLDLEEAHYIESSLAFKFTSLKMTGKDVSGN